MQNTENIGKLHLVSEQKGEHVETQTWGLPSELLQTLLQACCLPELGATPQQAQGLKRLMLSDSKRFGLWASASELPWLFLTLSTWSSPCHGSAMQACSLHFAPRGR